MPVSTQIEDDLIALISKEQRSFRSMLFAGLGAIVVLVALSAAAGVYYSRVSANLQRTQVALQREAFEARRNSDQQSNRMSAQERRLNRIHDQIRAIAGAGQATVSEADALRAAEAYLFRGRRLTLGEESAIARAAQGATQPQLQALLSAVAGLNAWNQRNNEAIDNNANGLPRDLRLIRDQFTAAQADPAFSARASAGLAWITFLEAGATYSNYSTQHCDALEASIADASPGGPQLIWWRAQCDRKLGRTSDALGNYAQLLDQTWRTAFTTTDEGEMMLAMNGFHGVGTTLIVLNDDTDAVVQQWRPLARQACAPEADALMDIAIACLNKAIEMRERIGQTDNEVSGTRENLGFAYLRTGDAERAFQNAETVAETGLFAWNELVRALAASQLDTADSDAAGDEARRNIGFFGIGEFNPCEIRKLLNENQFEAAIEILSDEHSEAAVQAAVAQCSAP
jgi:hypothetical protein